jgi:hypothetical protein
MTFPSSHPTTLTPGIMVHRTQSIIHSWLSTVASRKQRKIEDVTTHEECIKQQRRQWNTGKDNWYKCSKQTKEQQQLQKQDEEQVEEDEPWTGTMTHHNELASTVTKTVHSNLTLVSYETVIRGAKDLWQQNIHTTLWIMHTTRRPECITKNVHNFVNLN